MFFFFNYIFIKLFNSMLKQLKSWFTQLANLKSSWGKLVKRFVYLHSNNRDWLIRY